ncbi:MAG: sulfatase-like hydrolase/transferase, partial [Pirellulaceae bacterium]|nr:sulfatase-like hydrolase/transferase [Pirellulaceae bacterium]
MKMSTPINMIRRFFTALCLLTVLTGLWTTGLAADRPPNFVVIFCDDLAYADIGPFGALGALGPAAKHGIHDDEVLLPEILKARGYATAIFGKWHLGHHPQFLPPRHGFDRYFGLPYSNDMWPKHPTNKSFPPLPLIDGEKTIELDPDQTQLTTWYTERAVQFIADQHDKPFFLYVPHNMPHVPLFVSEKYRGKTERGLFGDVIAEID